MRTFLSRFIFLRTFLSDFFASNTFLSKFTQKNAQKSTQKSPQGKKSSKKYSKKSFFYFFELKTFICIHVYIHVCVSQKCEMADFLRNREEFPNFLLELSWSIDHSAQLGHPKFFATLPDFDIKIFMSFRDLLWTALPGRPPPRTYETR